MSSLSKGIENYISMRQSFGFKIRGPISVLRQFSVFCDEHKQSRLTIAMVLDWIGSYPASDLSVSRRIQAIRGFAEYWKSFDPKTEIPPREMMRPYRRSKPHIYTDLEIQKIIKACDQFGAERGRSNPIRRQTFKTMFGLIASTGLRKSEALNIQRSHVNLQEGTLLIELTKFRKSRLIPIHRSVIRKLKQYALFRDKEIAKCNCENFFVMNRGQPVSEGAFTYAFLHSSHYAGLRPSPGGQGYPRIHDLRHTFVVRAILGWLNSGMDVHTMMPALSTYLGHAQPSDTYWYLTGVPELMRFGLHEV